MALAEQATSAVDPLGAPAVRVRPVPIPDRPAPDPSGDDLGAAYLNARDDADRNQALDWLLQGSVDTGPGAGSPAAAALPAPPAPTALERAGSIASDIGRGIVEAPRQALGGVSDAIHAVFTGLDSLAGWLNKNVADLTYEPVETGAAPVDQLLTNPLQAFAGPADPAERGFPAAESGTGGVVRSASQFLTGFIPAVRALKAAGAGNLAAAAAGGAAADFAVFGPHEERLSNLWQEMGLPQNALTDYLAADPADSEIEGRFKNALEGAGLGGMAEGVFWAARLLRDARRARTAAEGLTGQPAPPASAAGEAAAIAERDLLLLGDPTKPLIQEAPAETGAAMLRGVDGPAGERAVNINLARINTADDVKSAIDEASRLYAGSIDEARRGVQSNEETARLAAALNMTPEELLRRRGGEAFNAEQALAARQILVSSGEQLVAFARKAQGVDATEADLVAFRRALSLHAGIQEQVSGLTAEAGRALQAFRIGAAGDAGRARQIRDLLEASGGPDATRQMAAKLALLDDPAKINEVARKAWGAKATDVFLEVWINSLLSGPQTHVVNMLSNTMTALWQIPERALAAQISRVTGSNAVVRGEATAQTFGMVQGFREGLIAAGKVLRTGEPADALAKVETRRFRAISAEGLNLSGTPGRAVDFLGEVVRVPGRLLMASDELFKAVGYRMELYAQAYRQAAGEGLDAASAAARVQEIVAHPPENLHLAAIDAARYQTFTQPLGPAGQAIQKAANDVPALRLIIPFIRTPANIMKFVGERSPAAPLMRQFRADVMAGGARRDLALARMSMGSMVMAVGADLTMGGQITGGGPSDPNLRAALRNTGWQPYSIKIGDTYYAYNRLDPLGMTIGLAADTAEILGQTPEAERDSVAAAMVMAVAKNVVSKTYLSGIADLMEVFSDPDRYGPMYLQRYAGTLIPTGVAQVERAVDPTLRDARSMLDQIRSRTPGYSDSLPPRRNLWGEPIVLSGGLGPDIVSPIYTSTEKSSPVDEEIVRNQVSVAMPARVISGVELSPAEYSRYVELAGVPAKAKLEALVSGKDPMSAAYSRASEGPDGGKALTIRSIVNAYREQAKAQMQIEFPELRDAIEAERRRAALQLQGP
jgi:hypothetical protein